MLMEKIQNCIHEITVAIGEKQVSTDMPTRISYRIAHGPEATLHKNLDGFTPACVVRPRHTEDVVEILKYANKYKIPIIPQGGRTCSYGAESLRDGIVIDICSMDKILDLDEGALRITAEAGVRLTDFMDYLAERNYLNLEIPTMNKTSTLGARASVSGYNKYDNRFGSSLTNIKAMEVVLPTGEVVEVGRGTRLPVRSAVGTDNMSIFIGSRGTLGVITKLTEKIIPMPPEYHYGIMAFKKPNDAINAFIELKSPLNASGIWRTKAYHKWKLKQAVKMSHNLSWPEGVEMLVDYHILGYKEVVDVYKKRAAEICKSYNGFWRDDMPPSDFVAKSHETAEKYMGMAAIQSERLVTGGMGNRLVPLDPMISDTHMIDYFQDALELFKKMEDPKSYPSLSKCMHVLGPGSPISAEEGWSKVWGLTLLDWKHFDEKAIDEFKNWFRYEYAELVWRHGGTLTGTHGFIPRDVEIEIIKRETGEAGYALSKN